MQELTTFIKAGYACIQIVTAEEERAILAINGSTRKALHHKTRGAYDIWNWSVTSGLRHESGRLVNGDREEKILTKEPVTMLQHLLSVPERSLVILKDFHMFLKVPNPMIIRLLKEAIAIGRKTNRHLILIGCQVNMQPELEKEIQIMDLPMPSRDDLKEVVNSIAKSAKIGEMNGETEAVLSALAGLTTTEASDAISYSIIKSKKMDPAIISRVKSDTIRRNGIVEIVDKDVSLDDIGGLVSFKKHLINISGLFKPEAREYGIEQPASIIAVGQAGTGKSMSAMATKTAFGLPLLRLEAGRLFNMYVGESERNWRNAFATAKAIAPVILWMDEAEALFARSGSQRDCGAGNGIVKTILQDMQMNSDGVFFIFTSNDIDGFPDPLIDRCKVWAFELPTKDERESIWPIHIKKRKRKPNDYDVAMLAEKTDGFSGRQIEQAWVEAMTLAYNDKRREPTNKDVSNVLTQFVPTSVTMRAQIERRRERLKGRAQSAS